MRRVRRFWLQHPIRRAERRFCPRRQRADVGTYLRISALLGIGLALLLIGLCEQAIRPVVTALAEINAKNAIASMITEVVDSTLTKETISYDEMVSLQKDSMGRITALSTNAARLNALRTQILAEIITQVKTLDSKSLGIPLGNLTGLVAISDRGPLFPVRVQTVADAEAAFHNVFFSAGINQTLHRIVLDVTVTVKLLLPGGAVEVPVFAQISVCETVIVGEVPNSYLQLGAEKTE